MINMYLSHPKTQKQMVLLCNLAQKKSGSIVFYVMGVQYVFAALFMPLAVLELIADIVMFSNYTPPRKNEENKPNE
jgi:hypothetical protein